jgi:hypothetical protein
MFRMGRFRGLLNRTIPIFFSLLLLAGCSRPAGVAADDATTSTEQQVPFHEDGSATASGPNVTSISKKDKDKDEAQKPETELPFRDTESLPAGTLLTVRLKNPISAENPVAKGTFEAILDEPVVSEGNTLVPRGITVAGRVESARASKVKRNRGYVRLTLDSIDLAGKDLPIQTSSLFARGVAPDTDPSAVTLEKGRRLTFRLAESVSIAPQQIVSGR